MSLELGCRERPAVRLLDLWERRWSRLALLVASPDDTEFTWENGPEWARDPDPQEGLAASPSGAQSAATRAAPDGREPTR